MFYKLAPVLNQLVVARRYGHIIIAAMLHSRPSYSHRMRGYVCNKCYTVTLAYQNSLGPNPSQISEISGYVNCTVPAMMVIWNFIAMIAPLTVKMKLTKVGPYKKASI